VLESEIESKVNVEAKALGFIQTKMGAISGSGWPDRLYLYRGRAFFIEFKAAGEKATPLQIHMHSLLIRAGFEVEVIDDVQRGKAQLRKWRDHADTELA
jgi:hypothetical protein